MADLSVQQVREILAAGLVIPAHPLALTSQRTLDERRQMGLSRYYLAAGAGGLAVGVHTTQFEIREPNVGLYKPVLELAIAAIREQTATIACRSSGSPGSAARPNRPSARRRWPATLATTRAS